MTLPIDVVLEILMLNLCYVDLDGGSGVMATVSVDPLLVFTDRTLKGLREKVREYLLTLVPKPKLLSECEEGKFYEAFIPGSRPVARFKNQVVDSEYRGCGGRPDMYQVIQPVEVPHEQAD